MKKLIDAFEVKAPQITSLSNDFETFKNKTLLNELRNKIIQNVIDKKMSGKGRVDEYIKTEIDKTIKNYNLTSSEVSYLYDLIENEITGNGPLTDLLKEDDVTEIMVNGPNDIYIEVNGKVLKEESISFINNEHIIRTIQRMIQPVGRTIDNSTPMVDARLKDGSRLNAIIPPLALNGPVLTIRKFKKNLKTIDELLRAGTLTPYMARFLEAAVKSKLNILVVGGTGSGKTTLLNVLSSFIDKSERIVTIEDAAELSLEQEHVVSLETKPATYEGVKNIGIRELVINALRMRPDRIIVGEVRGKEAFDMLQAMNTGHDGSITTLHANSPLDALNRLETMVLMAGMEIPIKAIREYIESAIDIVVDINRLSDGKRKIVSISEVVGFKDDEIALKEIFAFRQKGVTDLGTVVGEFVVYKRMPIVVKKMKSKGINKIEEIFE